MQKRYNKMTVDVQARTIVEPGDSSTVYPLRKYFKSSYILEKGTFILQFTSTTTVDLIMTVQEGRANSWNGDGRVLQAIKLY
ncbi:hypothetical protein GF406_16885 [candidate division KSB1 bacterium]|nr:hypothetical protein [candidate division KSB1 bacterium]